MHRGSWGRASRWRSCPAVRVHVQPAAARRGRHRRLGHPRREAPRRQVINIDTPNNILLLSLHCTFLNNFHLHVHHCQINPLKCSAIGSVLIVAGLYMVLWGKGREMMNGPALDEEAAGLNGKGSAAAAANNCDAVIILPIFATAAPMLDAIRN
jgi:hypothetical protein